MKVICISKTPNKKTDKSYDYLWDKLNIGSVYNVVEVMRNGDYVLMEFDDDTIWEKESFAPLSEIDETEFKRNYQKQPA